MKQILILSAVLALCGGQSVIKSGAYTNWQLFDLEADPSQSHNLAPQHPEVLARLKAQLLKINARIMADGTDWHQP